MKKKQEESEREREKDIRENKKDIYIRPHLFGILRTKYKLIPGTVVCAVILATRTVYIGCLQW
jgi:hypothetical protein